MKKIRVLRLNLAAEGAEGEGIEEAAFADLASVGHSLPRPRLRAFVQEHDSGAVDDVGLNAGDVEKFLNLGNPNHVVVGGPPNLNRNEQKENNHSDGGGER